MAKPDETAKKKVPAKKPATRARAAKKRVTPARNPALVDFVNLEWQAVAKGAREKGTRRAGVQLRLLELTREFEEVGFCLKGHAGVVLEGEMELEMAAGRARFREAQGFILQPGGKDRHRAKALTPELLLLLVDF